MKRSEMSAFQKDVIEDAATAFEHIASHLEMAMIYLEHTVGGHLTLGNALDGAAAYARMQAERLDKLVRLKA